MTLGRRGWAMIGSVAPPLCCGGFGTAMVAMDSTPHRLRHLFGAFSLFAGAPALGPFSPFGMWAAYEVKSWALVGVLALALWIPWLWLVFRTHGQRNPWACILISFLWCTIGTVLGLRAGMWIT